jgi:hypothetical protein
LVELGRKIMSDNRAPERIDGPTPAGGAYVILYHHDDGSLEIVEFTADGKELGRTYSEAPTLDTWSLIVGDDIFLDQ